MFNYDVTFKFSNVTTFYNSEHNVFVFPATKLLNKSVFFEEITALFDILLM